MISRFVGFNYNNINLLDDMSLTMAKNGINKEFTYNNINFNLKVRYINVKNNDKYNIKYYIDDTNYIIVILDGFLFNKEELINFIKNFDSNFNESINCNDSLIIAKMYILFKEKMLNYLNGNFSICIYENKYNRIFLARDHLGVKPLFYSIIDNNIIFASEIKALLKSNIISHIVDRDGIAMLIGLGPARIPGKTVYKDIKEIKPGHYAIYENNIFSEVRYFSFNSYEFTDNFDDIVKRIKYFISNNINEKIKLIDNKKIGCLINSNENSIIIPEILSNYFTCLNTFSIKYNNDYFINVLNKNFLLNHKYITINDYDIYQKLYEALKARDLPSMADIDSMLLCVYENIKESTDIIFSSDFINEVFCLNSWFYNNDDMLSNTFPFSNSLKLREKLLSKNININLKDYIDNVFGIAIKNVPFDDTKNEKDIDCKILQYLTIYFFGETLIEGCERMASNSGIEVMLPFTDYKLIEYVYNIPWKYKNINNSKKGILRECFKNILPTEIIDKINYLNSDFTNKNYEKIIKNKLINIINNTDNNIQKIIDLDFVKDLIFTENNNLKISWFGNKLMGKVQLMSYLVQLEMWIKEYNIIFDL